MTIFIVRLKPNADVKIDPEEKKKAGKLHHEYIESLVSKNIVLLGGPVVNAPELARGMMIVNLPSEKDVRETFSGDPMINKGVVSIQVTEWDIKHNSNNLNKIL